VIFVPGYSGGTALAYTSFPFILLAQDLCIFVLKKKPSLRHRSWVKQSLKQYLEHLYHRRTSYSDSQAIAPAYSCGYSLGLAPNSLLQLKLLKHSTFHLSTLFVSTKRRLVFSSKKSLRPHQQNFISQ
jgi:hypothetical protein